MLRTPVSHLPEPRIGQGTEGRARALLEALKTADGWDDDPWIRRLLSVEYREDAEGNPVRGQMLRRDDGRRTPTIDPETEALRRAKIRRSLKGRKRPEVVAEKLRAALRRANKARAIKRARARDPLREPGSGWRLGQGDKYHVRVETTFEGDE